MQEKFKKKQLKIKNYFWVKMSKIERPKIDISDSEDEKENDTSLQ